MERTVLTGAGLAKAMEELDGWEEAEGRICREYCFADFVEAFGFMTSAALHCEKLDHHPEWSNTYGRVRVELTTHDVGGVTAFDIELASRMDTLAEART